MNEVVTRPWGSYETLYESETYKVKKIVVNSNQAFSLQYHKYRWEDWIIVEGSGVIDDGWETRNCIIGDRFHIPPKNIHRAKALENGLVFIEIQRGTCDENDIVRLQDDYGRT
jgi:mannose-6-phosphate isomerase-like protein (cupin superfamily)